jgi:hypothetical protein
MRATAAPDHQQLAARSVALGRLALPESTAVPLVRNAVRRSASGSGAGIADTREIAHLNRSPAPVRQRRQNCE